MSLSAKQFRQYKLIVLLSTGKPVNRDIFLQKMDCSEPTFVRDLKEIRDDFLAEIKFDRKTNNYHMTSVGGITPKLIKHMREALAVRDMAGDAGNTGGTVVLDKEAKKPISLSLRSSIIRKIESYGIRHALNRSQVVELLVEKHLGGKKEK